MDSFQAAYRHYYDLELVDNFYLHHFSLLCNVLTEIDEH